MSTKFYDVFSELQVENDLNNILQDAIVEKVSTNPTRDNVRIYLCLHTLLPKRRLWKLENAIKKQYFNTENVEVRIIEKFNLSAQYNPEKIYEMYRDSMLEEIYKNSSLLYGVLKRADFDFTEENRIKVTVESTVVAKEKGDELHDYLDKVFCERCGQKVIINIDYKEAKKSDYIERTDRVIENVIASISSTRQRILEEQSKQSTVDPNTVEEKALVKNTTTSNNAAKEDKSKSTFVKKAPDDRSNGDFKSRKMGLKRSSHPDIIYGRDFEEEPIDIVEIQGEMGTVVIKGQIVSIDFREIRNEKSIVMMVVTDFTDSISVKMFLSNELREELLKEIKVGSFIRLKGVTAIDQYDRELNISSISGIMKQGDFRVKREDLAPVKRVELHCHTKMSDMDAVSNASDIVKQAKGWGHKAIAITDHGNVQAFPEAFHTAGHDPDFKLIYGVEAYLVDDEKRIVTDSHGQRLSETFVVFDIETTGFSAEKNRIIEIGAVKVSEGQIVDRFSEFINPEVPIPYRITELTSITDDMVINAPTVEVILPRFMEFSKGAIMVAHNADFDMSFIKENCKRLGIECNDTYLDTVELSKYLLPSLNNYKLQTVAKAVGVSLEHHHRAVDDAECTAEFFVKELSMLSDRGIDNLNALNAAVDMTPEAIMKLHPHHAIILAKNDIGRINLYRIISASHLKYFKRFPLVPKSLVRELKEGLLLGSACERGELFEAIENGRPQDEINRIADFYDYFEIQPLGNNMFKLESDRSPFNTIEDLQDANRRIVELGENLKKPVVATCDVHFLNPEDEIYRRIITSVKFKEEADNQPPLFLHTTEEMLAEFAYLGTEKAEEVVITNSNLIADMCDVIDPVRPDKCPPVIENSDITLRKICYDKAHAMYGPDLPEIVSARLERELNSIISNGYAVMYIIAQKLVWKSNEDGYLVGSRGSVGSSFVATMAGITEVNPLSPHYLCPNCFYVDFDSDEVKKFSGRSGCDMPDKICPKCGKPLNKEGFDIPFETFLGFKGNKEPDIDLNFSNDYQSKAHKYTEVIFGDGQTFKAGTIGTLADKTAYGYAIKYFEEHGVKKRQSELDRLVSGCTGIRRTTGQHPGGIIVLPMGEEINTFTPVQHPANDMESDIVTTHFDYHSIDSNLLKLDILGHLDPTVIRMLEDLTGLDAKTFPLDDKKVMSLFMNTDALGVTPDELWNVKLGTLGVPEFGTDFAMQMLIDAKPKEFSDLVRIAGLAHGTDVWLGNAKDLIEQGKATISTAICTRDDIMIYLIGMGLDSEESFKIMEAVRKGTVAKGKCDKWPEWKQDMIDHGVPDWYIWSCEKIKYMFPKAHAAAYVMMAWRVAYCKVYHPLAYYAAFFSIRATDFNYELMCLGKATLERHLKEYDAKEKMSAKEAGTYGDMRIVHEMYARGFEFLPMDLYQSDARYFKIVDGKLLPPFNSIEGMGDKAAETLAIAASQGKFLSKDDLRDRGKVSKTIVDKMEDLGVIRGLPESNQLSIFDMV